MLMGMLIDGRWSDTDRIIVAGAYQRQASAIRADDMGATALAIGREPARFCLIASRSCPWSHRATLLCGLKGLELPIHHAAGERREGYSLDHGRTWPIPGTALCAQHLHQLYTLHDPGYSGRVTVPVLWDSARRQIISNESADIVRILDRVQPTDGSGPDFTLRPASLEEKIDAANGELYESLNNGVYRAGFAESQVAYDGAVTVVFAMLDAIDSRLSESRYYFGSVLTETDVRLFPTLVRFDAIYAVLFKCSKRRLVDYPNLWAYARDLYGHRGILATVDFDTMRKASYRADSRDPHRIVAVAPDTDWTAPHGRAAMGLTHIMTRDGRRLAVEPNTFQQIDDGP